MREPVVVTPRARMLLAPNPGPMTLEGTNTWLLAEPGSRACLVVDPGPDDPAHIDALTEAISAAGQSVAAVALTHGHPDHAAAAPRLSRLYDAPVLAADSAYGATLPAELLVDGLTIHVVPTPGHSPDSVCFHIAEDRALLTGDHVLGRGTTLVEHPEGRMGDYLASLARVRALRAVCLLPGHGPVVSDPDAVLDEYIRHREERLAELQAAVADGVTTPSELVARIYPGIDPRLARAAELTVRAGIELLAERARG